MHFTQLQNINTGPVSHVALCPKRDLIAFVLGDGSFVIYRFSVSNRTHERLFPSLDGSTNPQSDATPTCPVTYLSWSPNGNNLALGYNDGSLFLMEVENHYIHGISVQASSKAAHLSNITHISWSSQISNNSQTSNLMTSKTVTEKTRAHYDRDLEFLLPSIRPCNEKKRIVSPVYGSGETKNDDGLLALIVADSSGKVSVSVGQGRFHVYSFDINAMLAHDEHTSPCSIIQTVMSPSLDTLTLIASTSCSQSGEISLRMIDIQTTALFTRKAELNLIATKASLFSDVMKEIVSGLHKAETLWTDACKAIGDKLVDFQTSLTQKYGLPLASPASEFLDALTKGAPSAPLEAWIARALIAEPLVVKFGKAFDVSAASVATLLDSTINRAAKFLVAHMSELHAHLQADECWSKFGSIGVYDTDQLLKECECLLLQVVALQRCVKRGRVRIASLFKFLRYLVVFATASGAEESASAIAAKQRVSLLKPSNTDSDSLISMFGEAAATYTANPTPITQPETGGSYRSSFARAGENTLSKMEAKKRTALTMTERTVSSPVSTFFANDDKPLPLHARLFYESITTHPPRGGSDSPPPIDVFPVGPPITAIETIHQQLKEVIRVATKLFNSPLRHCSHEGFGIDHPIEKQAQILAWKSSCSHSTILHNVAIKTYQEGWMCAFVSKTKDPDFQIAIVRGQYPNNELFNKFGTPDEKILNSLFGETFSVLDDDVEGSGGIYSVSLLVPPPSSSDESIVASKVAAVSLYGPENVLRSEDSREELSLLLEDTSSSGDITFRLLNIDIDSLDYCSANPCGINDCLAEGHAEAPKQDDDAVRWRVVDLKSAPLGIATNGNRGTAALISAVSVTLFDMEEDDEEEEEEEEEEEGQDVNGDTGDL